MSCPHVVWALRQRGLTAAERVVLIYLADRANGALFCWPSVSTIVQAVELSTRTVQNAIHRLADLSMIRIEARHRRTHCYHILRPPDASGPMTPDEVNGTKHNLTPKVIHRQQPPVSAKSAPNQPEVSAKSADEKPAPAILTGKNRHKVQILPANPAPYLPKKESPKKSAQGFSDSRLEGSKPAKAERQPTVAEIEAERRAYAADLDKLPPPLADALGKLGGKIGKIAYAPGRSPRLTVAEQIVAATSRPAKACPIPAELLAMMPHRRQAVALALVHA